MNNYQIKILHITPSYKPAWIYGGPTISISRLCESQALCGAIIEVNTTTANGTEELEVKKGECYKIDGVNVYYFNRLTKDHSHFSPALLLNLFFNINKFQIVHIHAWWNLVSMPALLICKIKGITPVLSSRGMFSTYSLTHGKSRLKQFLSKFFKNFICSNTIFHFTSQQEYQDSIINGDPLAKYFIAPNIVQLPQNISYKEISTSPQSELNLIFLGRIHPVKGLDLLFNALANVPFSWSLTIIGDGDVEYCQQLRTLSDSLNISSKIEWMGWLQGNSKYEALAKADLFVLPSLHENFANVIIESLAVGVPVLVSNQVGLSGYITQKEAGWVCAPNAGSIYSSLNMIQANRTRLKELRQILPALVQSDFDPKTIADQYIKAYRRLSNAKA